MKIYYNLDEPPEQAIEERDAYSETSEEEVCALFLCRKANWHVVARFARKVFTNYMTHMPACL